MLPSLRMTILLELLDITLLVIDAFDDLIIPNFIDGLLACALHGVTRSTLDTGLTVDLPSEKIAPLVQTGNGEMYSVSWKCSQIVWTWII